MKNLLGISLITVGCLYGVLAAVIILAFLLTDLPLEAGITLSLFIVVIQFLIAPSLNDWVFKHFYKTKFDYAIPEYLKEFIKESCELHNIKYPKIGFIPDGTPNAFTYGRNKNDARIVITKGIFDLLTEDEVKAVVAHEIGHIAHYDMMFMTVAQIVPLLLYYVYEALLNTSSGSSDDDNNYGALIGFIAYLLYIVSQYIILGLSRTREYYADAFAVDETKNPTAMGNALVKIGFGLAVGGKEENSKVSEGNALGISNKKFSKGMAITSYNNGGVSKENIIKAMKWERWNVWAKLHELNSTHPLISKRLLAISDKCEEYGQPRYIVFDEEQPESYVDDFFKELAISLLPTIIFLISLIVLLIMIEVNEDKALMTLGIGGILFVGSLFLSLNYTHKNKDYKETTVEDLLSEVKVSNITSVPCILKGKVIGRGNPGCIFNEDFVIQDETGIIFMDYNQPLYVLEKFYALFKSKENFDKEVTVKGWYRRGTAPYVEVYSMEIDGKVKKCHTYATSKVIYGILMVLSILAFVAGIMM